MFLGSAETIGTFTNFFTSLDTKSRIYRRLDTPIGIPDIEFPSAAFSPVLETSNLQRELKHTGNLQLLIDRLVLDKYAPAAVLTDDKGDILYISGRTGKYLEPAAGKANWNIFAMAREGLRYELESAFRKALKEKRRCHFKGTES